MGGGGSCLALQVLFRFCGSFAYRFCCSCSQLSMGQCKMWRASEILQSDKSQADLHNDFVRLRLFFHMSKIRVYEVTFVRP